MSLLDQLSKEYGYKFDDIQLLRDWIGQVFVVKKGGLRFILKIFRMQHSAAAIQSSEVMLYLKRKDFPVPAIMLTVNGKAFFNTKGDNRVAIMYEYMEGTEPELEPNLKEIGRLSGHMRKLMEQSQLELIHREEEFYIQRYISILSTKKYINTQKFLEHGITIWDRVKNSTLGFCHGDFHTGNMMLNNKSITLFDFDACGITHPIYDIATLCDGTDYFDLADQNFIKGIAKTKGHIDKFIQGYSKYYSITQNEIEAMYSCIAIRHFDIQATIIDCQGLNCVDHEFLDAQYRWLMKWEEACLKI